VVEVHLQLEDDIALGLRIEIDGTLQQGTEIGLEGSGFLGVTALRLSDFDLNHLSTFGGEQGVVCAADELPFLRAWVGAELGFHDNPPG